MLLKRLEFVFLAISSKCTRNCSRVNVFNMLHNNGSHYILEYSISPVRGVELWSSVTFEESSVRVYLHYNVRPFHMLVPT